MKNKILELLAKLAGAGKILGWFNGKKSYIAGIIAILTGTIGLLQGIVVINDVGAALAFLQTLPTSEALQQILAGLAVIGLRHSQTKVAKSTDTAAVPPIDPAVRD